MKTKVVVAKLLTPPIHPYSETVARELVKSIFPEERLSIWESDIHYGYSRYIVIKVPKRNYYYLFIKNKPTLLLITKKKLSKAIIDQIAHEFSVPIKPQFVRKISYTVYTDSPKYDYRSKVEFEAYITTNDILNSNELKTAVKEMLRVTIPDLAGDPAIQEFTTERKFSEVLEEVIENNYPYLHYVAVIQRSARKETILIVRHFYRWFWTRFAELIFR